MQHIARGVDVPEDEIKQFVTRSPWDFDRVQQHLVASVPEELRSVGGALIVDDVGIVKQGRHSVGAYRQYSGTLGKVGNCQVAVNLVYSVPGGRVNADQKTWPLGTRLYVPRAWAEDDEYAMLRKEVRLPESFRFRTKPEMAIEMIDKVREESIPHRVTLADAGYGDDGGFRRALRERREAYILGVTPSNLRVIPAEAKISTPKPTSKGGRPRTAPIHAPNVKRQSPTQIAKSVTEWKSIEWSEGTKGTLSGSFHACKVRVVTGEAGRRAVTDETGWLLLEKRKNELKAYLCWGLDDVDIKTLVEYAHLRWTIEQFHREAKQILGFDRFEGRTWLGWHHHISLVLLAYAFLSTLRSRVKGRLPTLPAVARALVVEHETQELIQEGLPPPQARRYAESAVRRLTDW